MRLAVFSPSSHRCCAPPSSRPPPAATRRCSERARHSAHTRNSPTANTTYDVSSQVFTRLVETERGVSAAIPELAEKLDGLRDGLTYLFTLRRACTGRAATVHVRQRHSTRRRRLLSFRG